MLLPELLRIYGKGLSFLMENHKVPIQSCHVSFIHWSRPTCIPCGNNIPALVTIEGALYCIIIERSMHRSCDQRNIPEEFGAWLGFAS